MKPPRERVKPVKLRNSLLMKSSNTSSGLLPSAMNTPATAPMLTPAMISGLMPYSKSACSAPRCAYPFTKPPLRANPVP